MIEYKKKQKSHGGNCNDQLQEQTLPREIKGIRTFIKDYVLLNKIDNVWITFHPCC